jgi:hypothetical protein
MERDMEKIRQLFEFQRGQIEMIERDLQKVIGQCELQKRQNEDLFTRLQSLESNGLPLTTAAGESIAITHQKVDIALSQIISMEKSLFSFKRIHREHPLLTAEQHEPVSHTALPIEFPDALHKV